MSDLRIPMPPRRGKLFGAVYADATLARPPGSYSVTEKAEIKKAAREIDAHMRRVKK